MTYEMHELLEVGAAGSAIQAIKDCLVDEMSGVAGPNCEAIEDE